MSIVNRLSADKFATFAKGAGGAVITMTVIKAVGRPAFTLVDKNSTPEKKKYSATNEFLYQLICLGLALSFIPLFSKLGFKLTEKYVKTNPKAKELLEAVERQINQKEIVLDKNNKKVKGKINLFKHLTDDTLNAYNENKAIISSNEKTIVEKENAEKVLKELEPTAIAINKGKGGAELGSLVGSIVGLTIIAPSLGHQILHPIMKAIGMGKHQEDKVGSPNEIFLADAKVPEEKPSRINTQA